MPAAFIRWTLIGELFYFEVMSSKTFKLLLVFPVFFITVSFSSAQKDYSVQRQGLYYYITAQRLVSLKNSENDKKSGPILLEIDQPPGQRLHRHIEARTVLVIAPIARIRPFALRC